MNQSNFQARTTRTAAVPSWLVMLFVAFFIAGCVQEETPLSSANDTPTETPDDDNPPADDPPADDPPADDPPPGGPPADDPPADDPPADDPPPGDPPADDPPADDPPADDPPPMDDPPPPNDQDIFAATLHPLLTNPANFCAGCHGATQEPTIAVADVSIAYTAITSQQKVNLNDPAASRVYLRASVDRHNCGGDDNCDRVATEFLAAIQSWADQVADAAPPPDDGAPSAVLSMPTDFASGVDSSIARADAAVIAMFTFSEGAGDTTMDSSGVGDPIVLQLEGTEWVEGGGIRNVSGKAQAGPAESQKLFDMITAVGEYSVEAWVIPDNDAQDGPARIVSYSQDTGTRNFTMGQNAIYYQLRNRSANTNANGQPALEADNSPIALSLTHLVMTFDQDTGRKIYINGALVAEENTADTLDWAQGQSLVLGNEVTNNRIWQGIIQMAAIHNKALDSLEVQQNFDAGAGSLLTLRFDVSSVVGGASFIEMEASTLDSTSYLFAKPTLVSDQTGIAVKNIRIGVNGFKPVAAQPFRRIDTMVVQPPMELSPLGAVIPLSQGPEMDQFQLEFEVLGAQTGFAETVPPAAPPVPPEDVEEPVYGVRTFTQINDTMSNLTGINPGNVSNT
ncbi:MAG: LamG domain-containing protein, partial [Pseudomonadota bacterium]